MQSLVQSSSNWLQGTFCLYVSTHQGIVLYLYLIWNILKYRLFYVLCMIIIYCNMYNPTDDIHLFYTYRLPLGDFAKITILGSLVPLLFPISIQSIVIWTELKHNWVFILKHYNVVLHQNSRLNQHQKIEKKFYIRFYIHLERIIGRYESTIFQATDCFWCELNICTRIWPW